MSFSPQNFSFFQEPDSLLLQKKLGFPLEEAVHDTVKIDTNKEHKNSFIEAQRQFVSPVVGKKVSGKKKTVQDSTYKQTKSIPIKIKDSVDSTVVAISQDSLNAKEKSVDTTFKFKDIISNATILKKEIQPQKKTEYINLFQHHELKEQHTYPLALNRDNFAWEFFVMLFILISFTWVKVFYNKTIRQIFHALFSNSVINQMIRDENILVQKASVLLTIIFNIVAAFFLYRLSLIYEWENNFIGFGFGRFLIFALGISFLYSFKFIVLRLTGVVFETSKPMITYTFVIFLINNILGILLIPMVIALSFMPGYMENYIVKIAMVLIFTAFSYRIIKGLIIGYSFQNFSKFYLFVYLCALEIFPLLVLIKLFIS